MNTVIDFCQPLFALAQSNHHRFGMILRGDVSWTTQSLQQLIALNRDGEAFQLGGEPLNSISKYAKFNKGQQLLGQECSLLICDLSSGFDANSFTAVMGCLVGGGIAVIVPTSKTNSFENQWLERCFNALPVVEQGQPLPSLPKSVEAVNPNTAEVFSQQKMAVEKVIKVVEGHRKRPFVLTADRGRGKSSALGIASAQLMQRRSLTIVVTAPTLASVQPVFEHAKKGLPGAVSSKGLIAFEHSKLIFVAPDELLRGAVECDLLLVDEASAIPIPMLQEMVERFHRAVFSTTIHGYEGCGRGFSIKFQSWLKQQRPSCSFYHIEQPIRWAEGDPLELWSFDTFLLDAELESLSPVAKDGTLQKMDKQYLVECPDKLNSVFALLVNAHYQTTPNDLMSLLNDDAIQLYAQFSGNICCGCILTVKEGSLTSELIEQVQLGVRRPKGHLVPVMLANQLGLTQAAIQKSQRIMRIAVHPERQRQGVGQAMIESLASLSDYDFLSTSFGATSELVKFWRKCGFISIKLGSQRDHASGTHSLIMVKGAEFLAESDYEPFLSSFQFGLSEQFNQLETELVRSLLDEKDASVVKPRAVALLNRYCEGGSSYDSVAPILDSWWKASPIVLKSASDFYIRRLVQKCSWPVCIQEFHLVGRKQAEWQFRQDLRDLLDKMLP